MKIGSCGSVEIGEANESENNISSAIDKGG